MEEGSDSTDPFSDGVLGFNNPGKWSGTALSDALSCDFVERGGGEH